MTDAGWKGFDRSLINGLWPQANILETELTFDGATTNAIGDYDGTGNPATIFTVTGVVEVALIAVCTTSVEGASSTIEVGTAKLTTGLIALTTATNLIINEIWHDNSPDSSVELSSVAARSICMQDIILTVRIANATAGVIKFILLWQPISSDGNVVIA